jgi:hypothetical protein
MSVTNLEGYCDTRFNKGAAANLMYIEIIMLLTIGAAGGFVAGILLAHSQRKHVGVDWATGESTTSWVIFDQVTGKYRKPTAEEMEQGHKEIDRAMVTLNAAMKKLDDEMKKMDDRMEKMSGQMKEVFKEHIK